MTSLVIEQTRQDHNLSLTLKGQIDEEADYSGVRTDGIRTVAIDFAGVALINSTGIQRWIKFLGSFPKGTTMVFSRCTIRVVTQINLFPGFLAGRQVKIASFYAPYFCEACDSSCDILLETAKYFPEGAAAKAPPMRCPRCSGPAEFDGIEKKYFLFLTP